jgi:hypothetical protein
LAVHPQGRRENLTGRLTDAQAARCQRKWINHRRTLDRIITEMDQM